MERDNMKKVILICADFNFKRYAVFVCVCSSELKKKLKLDTFYAKCVLFVCVIN